MIDVRTGIRKTYRWQVGASRLRQASGRNPNRTSFRDHCLDEAVVSVPWCYRDPQRTTAPSKGGVLGGRSPVGITSTGGSVRNEAHTEQDPLLQAAMRDRALEVPTRRRHSHGDNKPFCTRTFVVRWGRTFRAARHGAPGKHGPRTSVVVRGNHQHHGPASQADTSHSASVPSQTGTSPQRERAGQIEGQGGDTSREEVLPSGDQSWSSKCSGESKGATAS
jgi:hypothetical protein